MSHKVWACASLGSCLSSFVLAAIPYLQFLALVISIAAGVRAWIASRKQK